MCYECTRKYHYWRWEQNPDETVRTGSALTVPESRIQTKQFELLQNWLSQRAEPWRNGSNWSSLDCSREQSLELFHVDQPWLFQRAEFREKTVRTASKLTVPESRALTRTLNCPTWPSLDCFKEQNSEKKNSPNCFRIDCPREQSLEETVPSGSALTVPESRVQEKTVRTASELTVPESRALTNLFHLVQPWLFQRAEPWRNGSNWFSLGCTSTKQQKSDKSFTVFRHSLSHIEWRMLRRLRA
jgi:hypothetical protein